MEIKDWLIIIVFMVGYLLIVNPFNVRRFIFKPVVPPPQEIIKGPRILVCSVGSNVVMAELAQADVAIYREVYGNAHMESFKNGAEFIENIKKGSYDIVHFLAEFDNEKKMVTLDHSVTDFDVATTARDNGVKLFFSAANNTTPFVRTKMGALPMHFVFTLDRQGAVFTLFLGRLLKQMAKGVSMPVAWNELAPQIPGESHVDVPSCVFAAGRGQALFLP